MIFVSFSGLDGAGKSTQVGLLENFFFKNGVDFATVHLLGEGTTVLSKTHSMPGISHLISWLRKGSKFPILKDILTIFRLINVVIDSRVTVRRESQRQTDIVIFDRYYYDVLFFIARDNPKFVSVCCFISKFFVPRPSFVLYFTADDHILLNRRPEHGTEEILKNKFYSRKILEQVCTLEVDGSVTAPETHNSIVSAFKQKVHI